MRGNKHHVLFYKAQHRAMEDTKVLCENKWLKPRIDTDVHTILHNEVVMVPVPDMHMAQRVRRDFEPVPGDYLASIDAYCFAIQEAQRCAKAGELERRIGDLVIMAVQMQKPFINEGLIE